MAHRRPNLPDFPWDTIADDIALAHRHPDGACDLSVGTPVDPTPDIGQRALTGAADSPGYPTVAGTPAMQQAIIDYLQNRWRSVSLSPQAIMATIGSKEFVAQAPWLLGVGLGATVVIPEVAYPTYEVGAVMVGARVVRADHPDALAGVTPDLIWLNSPSNPTGAVMSAADLAGWVEFARSVPAVLAVDECYGEFGWQADPVSVLDPRVNGGSLEGLIACFSLSKRSNLAGYRAGFLAGDPGIVQAMLGVRKHLGMMVPTPVQAAMVALLGDQGHVERQRQLYLDRRSRLSAALLAAGFRIDQSQAGLYLWTTRGDSGRQAAHWLASRGLIVAPGDFYGPRGRDHVRIALTASDERIDQACARLVV
ncbi:MAG: succinyldiaminopimelate transaminase [Propionibacteriaceae bacterium]|jgi:succinyldiaminopimelate transaminase|nr:succinyldiaminopimelate transaminase [Propionibacteriaceae bacterium]